MLKSQTSTTRAVASSSSKSEKIQEFICKSKKKQNLIFDFEGSIESRKETNEKKAAKNLENFINFTLFHEEFMKGPKNIIYGLFNKFSKEAQDISNKISLLMRNYFCGKEFSYSVVWVICWVYKTEETICLPLFKAFQFEEKPIFIDMFSNCYNNWDNYLDSADLPECFTCVPQNGIYEKNEFNKLKLNFFRVCSKRFTNNKIDYSQPLIGSLMDMVDQLKDKDLLMSWVTQISEKKRRFAKIFFATKLIPLEQCDVKKKRMIVATSSLLDIPEKVLMKMLNLKAFHEKLFEFHENNKVRLVTSLPFIPPQFRTGITFVPIIYDLFLKNSKQILHSESEFQIFMLEKESYAFSEFLSTHLGDKYVLESFGKHTLFIKDKAGREHGIVIHFKDYTLAISFGQIDEKLIQK